MQRPSRTLRPSTGLTPVRWIVVALILLSAGLCVVSWLIFGLWNAVTGLIVGVIVMDFAVQGALISNQHLVYALRPEARGRINTLFMGVMFLGGAAGSAGATLAWNAGGWTAVSALGAGAALLALVLQLSGRKAWPKSA